MTLATETPFSLEVRVMDASGEVLVHHLAIDAAGYRFGAGPATAADVWITVEASTVEQLRAHSVAVTEAVQTGRVRVGGDVSRLLAHEAALGEVVRHLAAGDAA